MTTKTKYKVLDGGGTQYLHYLKQYSLFFVKWYKWVVVPYPNGVDQMQCICSQIRQYGNVKKFIIKYPDIDEYFKTEYVERKKKYKKMGSR